MSEFDVVTGAFGYTGKYIARRLLAQGHRVRTLTGHPDHANSFSAQVEVAPFNFQNPAALAKSLEGAGTLYNTYWVRFSHGKVGFNEAVANTRTLIRAAREAGVQKITHISISNPSENSPLPYFHGKAILEKEIIQSGLHHAIIRPTVIFGREDILINNIAWFVRHFPVFAVPGSGKYRLQPVFVEDVAEIAVNAAAQEQNAVLDAVGPEVYTFDELINLIAKVLRRSVTLVHLNPSIALLSSKLVGLFVHDVILTRDEVAGLMANLLISSEPPRGQTRLSEWIEQNANHLGAQYASELKRHFR